MLDLIYQALRESGSPHINDVTMDNDSNTGEIILTTDDGTTTRDWVIRSRDITEADRGDRDED